MKTNKFKVEFVDKIPSNLKDGILYVCISCNVIVHRCACGCGERTITPIDKKYGWVMKYDGQAITLRPSIGNFSIPCRSHYYITDNNVEWIESPEQAHNKMLLVYEISDPNALYMIVVDDIANIPPK